MYAHVHAQVSVPVCVCARMYTALGMVLTYVTYLSQGLLWLFLPCMYVRIADFHRLSSLCHPSS